MKTRKSIGHRILLGIAAIALGIVVQVIGVTFGNLTGISAIEYIVGLLGFVVMGICIYKWAVK
jgi:hypothetical protein